MAVFPEASDFIAEVSGEVGEDAGEGAGTEAEPSGFRYYVKVGEGDEVARVVGGNLVGEEGCVLFCEIERAAEE